MLPRCGGTAAKAAASRDGSRLGGVVQGRFCGGGRIGLRTARCGGPESRPARVPWVRVRVRMIISTDSGKLNRQPWRSSRS